MVFFNGNFNILNNLNLIIISYVVLFVFLFGIVLGFGFLVVDCSIVV